MAERSKILIVDDEPFNVDLLEQQLEELGYETSSAANGQEALAKVAAEAPDLILHHGKIATVDKNFSLADAIAIRGERIVAVGSNDAVLAMKGDATKLIDLGGWVAPACQLPKRRMIVLE